MRLSLLRCCVSLAAAAGLCSACTPAALADYAGTNPPANIPASSMPAACASAPTGAACINGAITSLDAARASLSQGPYDVPNDFASLAPDQQDLILTNLDRTQYGLPPIPGLTAQLDQQAALGVQADDDPMTPPPDADWFGSTANWAGGDPNIVYAYYEWMYDDGPGSGNEDCQQAGDPGCWGHRDDVLWEFQSYPGYSGPLAMGADAGTDPSGQPGYAMLIAQGDASYQPVYTYTWTQAQADGAGTTPYNPGVPPTVTVTVKLSGPGRVSDSSGTTCTLGTCTFKETEGTAVTFTATPSAGATFSGWSGACSGTGACSVTPANSSSAITATFAAIPKPKIKITSAKVRGRKLTVKISAPKGTTLTCALTRKGHKGFGRDHFSKCGTTKSFAHLAKGRYRLRVQAGGVTVTKFITVR